MAFLAAAVSAQAVLVIGHFLLGARIYDDPSREHVVVPTLIALVIALGLSAAYATRPSRPLRWALATVVSVPFVAVFGLYHGGFGHGLKLAFYAAGTPPERLLEIFDSPDFAMPNDAAFEITGVATLVVGLVVAWWLVRLVRLGRS